MNWSQALNTMEQRAIKTDVIASEDAYFMATHVPFRKLDVLHGSKQDVDLKSESGLLKWSEEDVYERLIYNPDNIHRMILVCGKNGTGKSHLIRWLCARYKNDKERYDPSTEKIIFLRRLSNTIRGAIKQILDEGIVFDPEMRSKLEKFISSNQALDPDSYKRNIYHQYIVAIGSDSDNKTFSKGIRRDINAFLSDSRVEQLMLRSGGPIDRCFRMITAPTDKVSHGEPTFAEEDFLLPKDVKKAIKKSGSEEAQNILDEIAEESYVRKLVKYLNGFTPAVVQSCAEISSEGTKEIFMQLRRELKQQGKNLTIFIEDFTAFTGLDAELITVLASEHGGENRDLCRVTSIIGITDQYYNSFKANFTDRVQYQVFLDSGTYGTPEFLVEMTARYLNSIYCDPARIDEWFANQANPGDLPVAEFVPVYPWETVTVEGKELTLYPFNQKSIIALYEALQGPSDRYIKTPRTFLLHVLQEQMTRFFDGKLYNQWIFPSEDCIDCPIQLEDASHDSIIDGMNHLETEDRRRAKIALQFWGNSTATRTKDYIGAVPKAFFTDIGLAGFMGIGDDSETDDGINPTPDPDPVPDDHGIDPTELKRRKNLQDRLSDLNAWIATGDTLNYSADYRKWVRDFLQEAINWPADGIPAYTANKRLNAATAVYIDGQKETTTKDKAILVLERNKESKDLLTALVHRHYSNSWGFESGLYFQLRVASWLEKNRAQIVSSVTQNVCSSSDNSVVEWGVAVEYLQGAFLGYAMPHGNQLQLAQSLLAYKNGSTSKAPRSGKNAAWQATVRYLNDQEATYAECHEILKESLRTHMGRIDDQQKKVGFFRSRELLDVVDFYEKREWNLNNVPTNGKKSGAYVIANYLNNLLGKINQATTEEDALATLTLSRLEKHMGIMSEDNILQVLTAVSRMFGCFNSNHLPVSDNLRNSFVRDPAVKARNVMESYARVQVAMAADNPVKKLALYAKDPLADLVEFANYLDAIEKLISTTMVTAQKELKALSGGKDVSAIVQKGRTHLKKAKDAIDRLEVLSNVD